MDTENFKKYIEFVNQSDTAILILQELGYKRVGFNIVIKGKPIHQYTVLVDEVGKIKDVIPELQNPEFTVQIEEAHLLDLIANHEHLKEDPQLAVGYFNKVKMPLSVKMKIMAIVMSHGLV